MRTPLTAVPLLLVLSSGLSQIHSRLIKIPRVDWIEADHKIPENTTFRPQAGQQARPSRETLKMRCDSATRNILM